MIFDRPVSSRKSRAPATASFRARRSSGSRARASSPRSGLRDHRDPRAEARDRPRRQAHESAGCVCVRLRMSRSASICSHCLRSGSPAIRSGGSCARPSGGGPKDPMRASIASQLWAVGLPTERCARSRSRSSLGSGSSGSSSPKKPTAGVLGWPAEPGSSALAGLGLIGIALYQGYRGVSQKFFDDSKVEEMSRPDEDVDRSDRHGRSPCAHGRLRPDRDLPDQGRGRLQPEPGGRPRRCAREARFITPTDQLLLGIVAAGLVAFALFSFSDARYRRI